MRSLREDIARRRVELAASEARRGASRAETAAATGGRSGKPPNRRPVAAEPATRPTDPSIEDEWGLFDRNSAASRRCSTSSTR